MDCVPIEALNAMEEDLTKAVVKKLGIQLDTLLYDTTNFGSSGFRVGSRLRIRPLTG